MRMKHIAPQSMSIIMSTICKVFDICIENDALLTRIILLLISYLCIYVFIHDIRNRYICIYNIIQIYTRIKCSHQITKKMIPQSKDPISTAHVNTFYWQKNINLTQGYNSPNYSHIKMQHNHKLNCDPGIFGMQ